MIFLSISENIFLFVAGAGIVQSILLAALVYFHPRSDRSVNIFLAFYIICLSMILCVPFMLEIFTWRKSFFMEPFPMLLGPFLYFYARSFQESVSWRKVAPHLLGFSFCLIVAWLYHSYLLRKYSDLEEVSDEMMKNIPGYAFSILKIGWFVFYYFLTRRTLNVYQRSIRHLYSETSRIDLNWTKWLNNGNILFILFSIAITTLVHFYPEHMTLLMLVNVAVISPYVYIITYKGITQSTLWRQSGVSKKTIENDLRACETTLRDSTDKESRQQKSSLTTNNIADLIKLIVNAMETDKLYQETELSLQDLADKIQFPPYQVSLAINQGMKKNFYDLVNTYRVEEAKRLLLDIRNRNYTILSIAFEAGFNSKTTFNTVFKKFTGLTPTEFRDSQKANLERV